MIKKDYDSKKNLHLHATSFFRKLVWFDYARGLAEILIAGQLKAATLNFHLPYESQFQSYYQPAKAKSYFDFINFWALFFKVKVVWENTNILNPRDWSLVENPKYHPQNLDLCFDLGHFILGTKTQKQALGKVDSFFRRHGRQIKHLHLHINDLKHDLHWNKPAQVQKFLGIRRFKKLTHNRTFIYEKG